MNLNTYTAVTGLAAAIISAFIYLKFSYTAREVENKRVEMQLKMQENTLKIKNLGWQDDLQEEARKSGWSLTMKEYLFISGGSFLVMLVVGLVLRNVFVAVGGGLLAYMLPRYVIKNNRKKEYKLKVKLLKPALQAIASAHTYKPNIVSAIQHAVTSMQQPIKHDFELFLMDVEMGTAVKSALKSLRKRVNVKYLDFFIRVVSMAEDEGGRTHELIKTCAEIIDQDQLTMEEFEAEITAEKRATTQLLILQFVMFGFMSLTQQEAFTGYTQTLFGQIFVFYLMVSTFIIYQMADKLTDSIMEEVQGVV